MMRNALVRCMLPVFATGMAVPSMALAQSGTLSGMLRQALAASAKGDCPASILSPLVLGACEQAMPVIGQRLSALGAISDTKFLGVQATPQGPAEVYLVTFANGRLTWMIATSADGKISILWSPG